MKNKNQSQQGDVLFHRLETMPEGTQKLIAKGRCVLANGEHTGHQHVVEDDEAELIKIGERMILKLKRAVPAKHPEHGPFDNEPGLLEIGQVQECDYLSKMSRPVMD